MDLGRIGPDRGRIRLDLARRMAMLLGRDDRRKITAPFTTGPTFHGALFLGCSGGRHNEMIRFTRSQPQCLASRISFNRFAIAAILGLIEDEAISALMRIGHEDVVEIVGDAAGQRPEGVHLLQPPDVSFEIVLA